MKKFNFNIKDRRILTLGLCLMLVCVFTLTIAYSALSAVLTIQGNARVSAADWDIYLDNPRVTSGSATTNLPEIKTSSTLDFNTTLNMPGDFYEFVVDVVNNGSIDAMIENVVKTPDLTAEQAKFLKYEVSYQNGEAISNKQLLAKDATMPIKVRIEYRKDLTASDLPMGQIVLDLSLTLEYIQSDGSGSSVNNNGIQVIFANGDINEIGTIVTIGNEQFYTIGTEGYNVKLFARYNLYVGNEVVGTDEDGMYIKKSILNPTGLQDNTAIGEIFDSQGISVYPFIGTIEFSNDEQKGNNYSDYNGSVVEEYVNNYKNIIESYGIEIVEARLIMLHELSEANTFNCGMYKYCSDSYPWIYSTSYWTGSAYDSMEILKVATDGFINKGDYLNYFSYGVRPVIVISKDYFN